MFKQSAADALAHLVGRHEKALEVIVDDQVKADDFAILLGDVTRVALNIIGADRQFGLYGRQETRVISPRPFRRPGSSWARSAST